MNEVNEAVSQIQRAVDGKMWVDGSVSNYDIVGPYREAIPT